MEISDYPRLGDLHRARLPIANERKLLDSVGIKETDEQSGVFLRRTTWAIMHYKVDWRLEEYQPGEVKVCLEELDAAILVVLSWLSEERQGVNDAWAASVLWRYFEEPVIACRSARDEWDEVDEGPVVPYLTALHNAIAAATKDKTVARKGRIPKNAARSFVRELADIYESVLGKRPGIGSQTPFFRYAKICLACAGHEIASPLPYIRAALRSPKSR